MCVYVCARARLERLGVTLTLMNPQVPPPPFPSLLFSLSIPLSDSSLCTYMMAYGFQTQPCWRTGTPAWAAPPPPPPPPPRPL